MHAKLMVKGETFYIVPESDYRAMNKKVSPPAYPQPDANGDVDAVGYARASIARTLIAEREALGWSQAELARRSGVRVETLNRVERAKVTPDEATVRKLTRAMQRPAAKR